MCNAQPILFTYVTHHTGIQPGETQEVLGPDSHYNSWNLQLLQTSPLYIKTDTTRIKWPAASMFILWNQSDDDTQ